MCLEENNPEKRFSSSVYKRDIGFTASLDLFHRAARLSSCKKTGDRDVNRLFLERTIAPIHPTQPPRLFMMKSVAFCLAGVFVGLVGTSTKPVGAIPSDVVASSCSRSMASAKTMENRTIVGVAAANPSFSTLVKAVKEAGLVEVLSGKGPFTVFAPTDEAFAALPAGTLDRLLLPENRETLKKVLTYHVVSGALPSKGLRSGRVTTVEGSPVNVMVKDGRVMVNGANVVGADVAASNGVIHVIDKVILPPNL